MSTPAGPAVNGRQKRSLEHQLDRLDAILDGLADALGGAVAEAVKEAVGQAVRETVQAIVSELLANPQVASKIAEAHRLTPPPEPIVSKVPTWRERLAARLHRMRAAAVAAKDRVVDAVTGRLRAAHTTLTAAAGLAWADRRGVTFAAVAGVVVGVGCHICGPIVASTVGGITSAALALAGRLLRPLHPVLPLLASARTADRPDGPS